MIFKIQPKTFVDDLGIERTVIGLEARVISNVEFNLDSFQDLQLFVKRWTSGSVHTATNPTIKEFVDMAIEKGMPYESAVTQVNTMLAGICFGSVEQKYQAAQGLASIYGFVLLPLSEQDV